MNHFQFGFFDELEKIATNKDQVADWKKYFQKEYKGISRGLAGEAATHMAQSENNTRSRFEGQPKDPRFHSNNFRFDVSIPDPKVPGRRLVANREELNKFWARSGVDRRPSFIYQTAPQRAKFGVKPVGLR